MHIKQVTTPVLYRVWCAARLQLFPLQRPLTAEEQARGRVREQAAAILAASAVVNRRSVGRRGRRNLRQDDRHQQQQRQERQSFQSEQKRARRRGVLILAAGAALWFMVASVLAAWLFQMAFVVRADGRGRGGEGGSAGARGWAVGVLLSSLGGSPGRAIALGCFLLHTWAYVCQAGAPRWVHAAIRTVGLGLQQQEPRAERGAARGADGGREGGGGAQAEGRPLSWKDRIEVHTYTCEQRASCGDGECCFVHRDGRMLTFSRLGHAVGLFPLVTCLRAFLPYLIEARRCCQPVMVIFESKCAKGRSNGSVGHGQF